MDTTQIQPMQWTQECYHNIIMQQTITTTKELSIEPRTTSTTVTGTSTADITSTTNSDTTNMAAVDTRATDTQSITTTYDDYYHGYEGCVFNNYKYEWQNIKKDISEDDDETVITNNKYEECFNTGSKEKKRQKVSTRLSWERIGTQYLAMTMMTIGSRTCHSM